MRVGADDINSLPSNSEVKQVGGLKNPYREVLEALDLWESKNPKAKKLTVSELRELDVSPVSIMIIREWISSFKVPDDDLLNLREEEVKGKAEEIPVSVEILRKKAEEEALKWDLEHSNNLYYRYKLLKESQGDFELLKSKLSWADFGEKRKILVLSHYVMEALKQDTNIVTLASLRKPIHFYYQDKRGRLHFNDQAFKGFAKELGLDPEDPIGGENLAVILLRRFGYTEESLKGFYEEIVRDLIKPSRMRLPPCIEAIAFKPLFYDTKKGMIIDEALKILASWFKYYAKGYTTGRILIGKDKRIALFEFMISKLYGDVIPMTEQAKIIQRFKEFYEEAKPFKCGMVHQFESSFKRGSGIYEGSVGICSLKCPFVAPIDRVEEALASVEEVNLYGADYIEIKLEGIAPFFEPYSPSLSPKSKLVQNFAAFLQSLYKERIEPDKALEILDALLERARIVQNYLSPLVAVEEWFKEEMERLLGDGALPWELKAKDKPFLSKDGKILYVHRDLIEADLVGGIGLEGYTTQKLIRDLKKLPNSPIAGISDKITVKKDSYTDETTKARFWMIRVKWLKDHGIEVKVKVKVPALDLEEPEPKAEEKEPEEDLKDIGVNLTRLQELILEVTKEPKDIEELVDLGKKLRKEEGEVTSAVVSLMQLGLIKMEEGGKLRRAIQVGPNE